jgi:hypothetical protein
LIRFVKKNGNGMMRRRAADERFHRCCKMCRALILT